MLTTPVELRMFDPLRQQKFLKLYHPYISLLVRWLSASWHLSL
jgi:hypothetical protein